MLVFIYGTRVVITLIYPIGFIVDMAMGLFSYYIVGMATGSTANDIEKSIPDFYTTFLLTIVQGTLLNLVLAVWGMLCAVIALSFLFLIRRF